jgi:hypothetical protein
MGLCLVRLIRAGDPDASRRDDAAILMVNERFQHLTIHANEHDCQNALDVQ